MKPLDIDKLPLILLAPIWVFLSVVIVVVGMMAAVVFLFVWGSWREAMLRFWQGNI